MKRYSHVTKPTEQNIISIGDIYTINLNNVLPSCSCFRHVLLFFVFVKVIRVFDAPKSFIDKLTSLCQINDDSVSSKLINNLLNSGNVIGSWYFPEKNLMCNLTYEMKISYVKLVFICEILKPFITHVNQVLHVWERSDITSAMKILCVKMFQFHVFFT